MRAFLGAICAASLLAGCAIYPLPEDVIAVDSEQIATIVRCQARAAIHDEVLRNVVAFDYQHPGAVAYPGFTGPALVDHLRSDPRRWHRIEWARFTKELRDPFLFYKDALISYDFTIDTTEVNGAGVDLTLLEAFSKGTRKIGLVAKNDRSREVKRHFRVFDTFDSLARLQTEAFCAGTPAFANPVFPSAGLIKVGSLIRQFLQQNQNGNLGNLGDKVDISLPQLSDTITFTTKFTGNVDPTFELNSVTNKFVPSKIAVNVDNSRQDMHTIIILVQLPPKGEPAPRFDDIGRLTAVTASRLKAERGLDGQRDRNTQDAIIQIGNGAMRFFQ